MSIYASLQTFLYVVEIFPPFGLFISCFSTYGNIEGDPLFVYTPERVFRGSRRLFGTSNNSL